MAMLYYVLKSICKCERNVLLLINGIVVTKYGISEKNNCLMSLKFRRHFPSSTFYIHLKVVLNLPISNSQTNTPLPINQNCNFFFTMLTHFYMTLPFTYLQCTAVIISLRYRHELHFNWM